MPSKQTFPTVYFVITLAASAVIAAFFGFSAGFIAGNSAVMNSLLASLPPSVKRALPKTEEKKEPPAALAARETAPAVSEEGRVVAAVKKASPAVVSIVVSKDVPVFEQYSTSPFGDNDFFRQFFEGFPQFQVPQYRQKGTEKKEVGAGSGFIVSADGYVVTNKHVVADEAADYTAITSDGKKYPAKVLARDPSNDIAVLKLDAAGLPFIAMGDSDALDVGQRVIAIGYALGQFSNTVSTGIVSGLKRSITAGDGLGRAENLFEVIQTDAAINPGNSGGPLLDLEGKAVGVNVAIVQGSQNIGFALPINDVKKAVAGVRKSGRIVRPFLGVRFVIVTKAFQEATQLPVDHGALIVRGDTPTDLAVLSGSPADKAGLVENDIILEVEGKKITADYPLNAAIGKYSVGDPVKMKILHKGVEKNIEVTLAEKK